MTDKIFNNLFLMAQQNGGVQYIYSLLRVEGIERYDIDPILDLYNQYIKASHNDLSTIYELILKSYPIFSLIANLINNSQGESYKYHPFSDSPKGKFPEFKPPDPSVFIIELVNKVTQIDKKNEFSKLFNNTFDSRFVGLVSNKEIKINDYKKEIVNIKNFLIAFIKFYFNKLIEYNKSNKFQKFNNYFDVLEILCVPERGLYGFNIHHSNGSCSSFQRLEKGTESINLFLENNKVGIFIGNQDDIKPIWLVNNMPLYEIGLPGKYNLTGEWRPLVYPGPTELIDKEIEILTKDEPDSRLRGLLFYSMTTCHHAIEFILKSNFDLPYQISIAESSCGKLYLEKIELKKTGSNTGENRKVYDCVLYLSKFNLNEFKIGLQFIQITLNRLAFRLNGKCDWVLKYPLESKLDGLITTQEEDHKLLSDYLTNLGGKDSLIHDSAIDWYVNGNKSENIFNSFLCYSIAIESICIPFCNGEMEASTIYGVNKLSKQERKEKREECIHNKFEAMYKIDPKKFIEESYFECITTLKASIKKTLQTIFGEKHEYVQLMFGKVNGYSLYDIRSNLAHGTFSLADVDNELIVMKRIGEIKTIAQELILRISIGLKPEENYKEFAQTRKLKILSGDPRSTAVVSNLEIIPNKDWKINWDWLC